MRLRERLVSSWTPPYRAHGAVVGSRHVRWKDEVCAVASGAARPLALLGPWRFFSDLQWLCCCG